MIAMYKNLSFIQFKKSLLISPFQFCNSIVLRLSMYTNDKNDRTKRMANQIIVLNREIDPMQFIFETSEREKKGDHIILLLTKSSKCITLHKKKLRENLQLSNSLNRTKRKGFRNV